ncbi:MAG TPA: FKBP-type peptidyl-prolyl cis-trans isomerase [Telluria sp.]|nr:FKBP-type peptidyl-prolyl cis-trans isomerase [Telluria sp.]
MIRRSVFIAMLLAAAGASAQDTRQAAQAGAAASAQSTAEQAAAQQAAPAEAPAPKVEIIDNVVGKGKEAVPGKTVVVHYTGWFYKPVAPKQRGRKFDSSLDRGQPLDFPLGAGRVIKGWDQGVAGMKVGGKRTLIIPSDLAYGKRGAGGGVIPPDSDLIFDVELLDVK